MIREATVEDLMDVGPCAERFYASSAFLTDFNINVFAASWKAILSAGYGVIFLLLEGEKIVGAIGGLTYPDMNSGKVTATETFWFVDEENRGMGGINLYRRLERWAREKGCASLRMGHMIDLMPGKLKELYSRLGYRVIEVTYSKELTA